VEPRLLARGRRPPEETGVVERISYLGDAPPPTTERRRVIPRIMTATTAGMVAVTVALTVFAGPLYALCASIGDALLTPVTLVQLEQEAPMSPTAKAAASVWRQLPFFVWLVALWMLLWGSSRCSPPDRRRRGARRDARLPAAPVELSGRVNLWYGLVFVVMFFLALVRGSLLVAWQTLNPRRYPGTAVIAVPLRTDDDLIMAHVGVTASLIPGSLIIDVDRDRRILYLHVIGVSSDEDVENSAAPCRAGRRASCAPSARARS
jgi:multicomponent Na+:H+ antiporter subunit E